MKLGRLVIGMTTWTWAATCFAGGWTSGGGELLGTDTNPWFVQSARTERVVRYCIVVDEANFGLTYRDVSRQVRQSFSYWYDEFSSALQTQVYVALETFVEQDDCNGNESLRFQFGVIDPDQERQFREHGQDPRRFVAVAIRTEYDEEHLEGKGFVYVSPPRGPLGMTGTDLVPDPWAMDGQMRLGAVLKHELGHVFGLTHNGDHAELMSGGFPEMTVGRTNPMSGYYRGVFRVPQGTPISQHCYYDEAAPDRVMRFFGLTTLPRCIQFAVIGQRVDVRTQAAENAPYVSAGLLELESDKVTRMESLVRLWLPPGQTRFPNPNGQSFLSGPIVVDKQAKGTYSASSNGETRQMHVHISPSHFQIGGVLDGRLIMDIYDALERP